MIKAWKKRLIGYGLIAVGIICIGLRSEAFAQTSHLFRTYKHEVPPKKLAETPEAIAEGKKIYEKRCWYCHGIKGGGDGPAAVTMFPKPRNFTRNEYKVRSTTSGSVPTDEDLFRIITSGIEGTAMPFWSTISETERWQVIYYIKTFNDQFKAGEPKTVTVGNVAPTQESIERGKELFTEMKCIVCHGEDGRGTGPLTVALQTQWDMPYRARDLHKGWTFKGGNKSADIFRTISTGFNETPMGSYLEKLNDDDRWHLAHYVNSLAKDMASDVVVKVKLIESETLPEDPADEAWGAASAVEVPLAGQIVAAPRQWWPAVDAVSIKGLYNSSEIAFLIEWDDTTNLQEEVFRDGVSLQFPSKVPDSLSKPYFGMGGSGGSVNLWYWQAFYPEGGTGVLEAPVNEPGIVKELNAKGFKKIKLQEAESQDIKGSGLNENGRWKVVVKRSLKTDDEKKDIQFEVGKLIPIAFAVWDGSNSDVGSQKSVSAWYYIMLEQPASNTIYIYVLAAIIMGASVELWFVARLRRFPPKLEEEQD